MTCDRHLILVVDDERVLRRLIRMNLERAGFEVADAENGQVALEIIEQRGPPALALVDLMMPVMDGEEFMTAATARVPGIRAVLVSASPEARHVADRFGIPLVPKPYEMTRLLERVWETIDQQQAS